MSVLIKGMDMPKDCADCDIHNPFSDTPYCRRLLQAIPIEGRLKNCPLIEVKTPHGRLIDAEACMRDVLENRTIKLGSGKQFDKVDMGVFAAQAIDEASVIIEAEY